MSQRGFVEQWQLRAAFARSLSDMYGTEVPAYTTLLEVSHEVNADVMAADADAAQRLGSIDRVTAERHGAIRLGTPAEMQQVARVFGAIGMHPVGFYDLREAATSAVPVVSTAFRPIEAEELARNPFRVFTSVITSSDRRFFSPDLQQRLQNFLGRREIFPPELLDLADRAEAERGLPSDEAQRFLELATAVFELSPEPVDRAWYDELEQVSAVAADIGGVGSTHINHLTPRVLDIDALYERMQARGITMIDDIQGPPRWEGPDVLLRQTSFRALAEPRTFRMPDGSITQDALRVRFGEVEARGIALTRAGRDIYDNAIVEAKRLGAERGITSAEGRQEVLRELWRRDFPSTEDGLAERGLAYFTHGVDGAGNPTRTPIVYEDFLPASAAGIFQSNLTSDGSKDTTQEATALDADWMAGALGRDLHDPFDLYAAQESASRAALDHRTARSSP
ncbi:2-oxoadipate dioxygenase/decarboxylase [Pseudactinotalea suaedae]|uniref:2-oxoadipate dioxygenase/decarboxylase n=1 Tax=Pseudactinotalea suaedae TaxID=1524924 RepID=UPI0012E109C9|nr:VOC family protein [Pseudactinotalea suaedae]